MIVSQGKYVLQRKWAYMSRVSINYLRVKKSNRSILYA